MSVRVISTPIAGSPLASIAIGGGDGKWFARRPSSAAEWKSRADAVRGSLLNQQWLDSIAPAFDATGKAAERLERAATSGIAVTTGQQPGLFGGPLYTWWKALSALALADQLEKITGIPVVPIFWAATDDSDFQEAAYTVVSTVDGARRIAIEGDAPTGTPMADVPIGDVSAQLAHVVDAAGSASSAAVIDVVRRSYSPGHTIGSAYVEMLRSLFEPLGIPVLDASHAAVRRAAHPLLTHALERAEEIDDALTERVRDLKAAGHAAQVKLVKGRTLVFGGYGGARDRIRIRDASDSMHTAAIGSLGPNVLLRPIVERAIIPTAAYVGGPAEIAYFAETTAVADVLRVPAPLVVPRWSGMVMEPKIDRILARYNLTPDDFRDPHAVETRIARSSLPSGLAANLADLRRSIERSTNALASGEGAELVPEGVVDGLRKIFAKRLERVERRFAASVKRTGNQALRDAATARGALYPLGTAQERALNIVPLLARHGDELIRAVLSEASEHAARLTG